ncbi:hypothetical protein VIGAN_04007100 [Vigna angularis var. angularis]|uniref:Uncharacterized protein n=1 Tax=Vigna angularis var. angularis TaxID=157739 RepID=A0A0S3RQW9_PHAAN|nr:hypothetical protein VIGAN_04007100 [Vigna angularis var. angularis]
MGSSQLREQKHTIYLKFQRWHYKKYVYYRRINTDGLLSFGKAVTVPKEYALRCEIFSLPKPLDPNLNGGHFFAIPASSRFSLLPSLPHTVSLLFAKPQHHPSLLYAKCKPSDDIDTSNNETKGHEPNVTSKREVQNYSLVGIPKLMPS